MTGNPFLDFLLRKLTVSAVLLLMYLIFDRGLMRRFDTAAKIEESPIAIAILLGLFSHAVAIA